MMCLGLCVVIFDEDATNNLSMQNISGVSNKVVN